MTSAGTADSVAVERLREAARLAADRAYAPYSRFPVGAACLAASGNVYPGCNVENASFGMTICAERAAIFAAVAAGERDIRCVLVYTPTPMPTTPCGACRQVICEFGTRVRVIACCDGPGTREWSAEELLPAAFDLPHDGDVPRPS